MALIFLLENGIIYSHKGSYMISVRWANINDIEEMCKVNTQSWLTTYKSILPKDVLDKRIASEETRIINTKKDLIEHPDNIKLVGLVDERVVGMCLAGESETNSFKDAGEIYNLYLLKEYQGLHLGSMMFERAIIELLKQGYNDLVLKCISNNPSCKFYENKGGKLVEVIDCQIYGYPVKENIYFYEDIKKLMK